MYTGRDGETLEFEILWDSYSYFENKIKSIIYLSIVKQCVRPDIKSNCDNLFREDLCLSKRVVLTVKCKQECGLALENELLKDGAG